MGAVSGAVDGVLRGAVRLHMPGVSTKLRTSGFDKGCKIPLSSLSARAPQQEAAQCYSPVQQPSAAAQYNSPVQQPSATAQSNSPLPQPSATAQCYSPGLAPVKPAITYTGSQGATPEQGG